MSLHVPPDAREYCQTPLVKFAITSAGTKIVLTPNVARTAIAGRVLLKSLCGHVLELAGLRRKVGTRPRRAGSKPTSQATLAAGAGCQRNRHGPVLAEPRRNQNATVSSALSGGAASAPPGSRNQSVVVTDWGADPVPTVAGVMALSAPPAPIVYCDTVLSPSFAT